MKGMEGSLKSLDLTKLRENQQQPRDTARLFFEVALAPGEKKTFSPTRVERVHAYVKKDAVRLTVHYREPVEVPAHSVKPFKINYIGFSNAPLHVYLTSLKSDDRENLATPYTGDGIHVSVIPPSIPAFSVKTAAGVSITLWNRGAEAVEFTVRIDGPTMPEA
jgi:hypothetical protein